MRLAGPLRAAAGGGGWRERFDCGGRDVARWFPGHMARGLKDMRRTLRDVDGLLEVHDARIPLSGRNPVLQEVLGLRPHLLVLNKMDLADLTHKSRILELLEQQGLQQVVFTDCLTDENVKKLIPILTGLIKNSQRYQRAENVDSNIMVIGVPNVGKSSIINSLRRLHLGKGKAAPVGAAPGVTRAVLTKIQVSEKPLVYLLDTPGVLSPQIKSVETGLKLALCGAILDHLVGVEVIADYLLYVLNQQQQFSYVERYGLSGPCDEVGSVLKSIAQHLGKVQKVQVLTGTGNVNVAVPNYNAAACEFIYTFRKGLLGKVMLDQGILG
ncbi:mitochondrial ribosome-associated GTPase 1 [Pseudonaja textilis]|uniref:mitochondrial ribosome-associated GTPase 1 n=1 Tax=Pseudonaja textilis TaxID=8673 RepID=UPI000EA9133D|nr:mitochondrial ribosome-associated GTPase 1 [Pseudonaja textilis]XP_026576260.1 mitochondrial ribosome-associated GTPase 1 [Pseudonaja textilis]